MRGMVISIEAKPKRNNMKRTPFIIYLAALCALSAFSTDIYLASMPIIQKLLQASITQIQLTLSFFFIAFASMQLFWGPLSDRLGRKPVIYIGVTVFTLGCLLSALSQNATQLIISRIIQATGACSGVVSAFSMIKDTYSDHQSISKALSSITITLMIAPMIAPIIGSHLLTHINWEANFYFLAIGGFILIGLSFFIKESHPKDKRHPLPIKKLLSAYIQQIKHRPFLLSTLATATTFSVMFSFISSSSFIYIDLYHVQPGHFGYFFALNAAGLILGSFTTKLFKRKVKDITLIVLGLLCCLLGSSIMISTIHALSFSVWGVAIPAFIATFGVGILFPEVNSYALKHVVAYNGLASSLIGTTRYSFAAVIGYVLSLTVSHSAIPLAISMLSLSVTTCLLMLIYFKDQKP